MKIIFIIFSSLVTILMGCVNGNSPVKKEQLKKGDNQSIVLVFYRNPLLKESKKGSFYTVNKISYYDENMLLKEVDLNNRLKNDTITIFTKRQFMPVDLFDNYIIYNYHFKKGDTILFGFKDDIPIVQDRLNSLYYDLNYSFEYKKRFSMPLKGNNFITMTKDTLATATKFQNLNTKYVNQQSFLDSLQKGNKISSEVLTFFRNQNDFEFFSQPTQNPALEPHFNKMTNRLHFDKMINDKVYFNNGYFHGFLIWKYLRSQKLNIKRVKNSSGISLDYKQAYEVTKKIFLDKGLKEAMLLYDLEMIGEEEPKEVFKSFQIKFKEMYPICFTKPI